MRHRKHNHILGVKTQHRKALLSNLCAALIQHGRIRTTLAKAKALRPLVEKMITRAKKAKASDDPAVSLHHRRQCSRHLRDKAVAHMLFNEKVDEFMDRSGGYVRIYKLGQVRLGDSAEMALVELVPGADEGYPKRRKKKTSKPKASDSKPKQTEEQPIPAEDKVEEQTQEEEVEESSPEDNADDQKDEDLEESSQNSEELVDQETQSVAESSEKVTEEEAPDDTDHDAEATNGSPNEDNDSTEELDDQTPDENEVTEDKKDSA